jgi:MarR-like DNA-binding transcriptional regulator SgrR of sgrS sRNA
MRRRYSRKGASMTPRQAETLAIIQERQPVAMADVAHRLGCEGATARTYLHQLHQAGLIVPSSSGRWARWRIAPPPKPPEPETVALRRAIEQAPSIWHYAQRLRAISGVST